MSRNVKHDGSVAERIVRTMAVATAGYSVAICIRPRLLVGPSHFLTATGEVSQAMTTMTRSTGTRDILLALLLAASPAGRPMAMLSVARAVADGGDALWFARSVPAGQRWKVSGAAAVWALTEFALGLTAARGASARS
jgi:hypothetical protein